MPVQAYCRRLADAEAGAEARTLGWQQQGRSQRFSRGRQAPRRWGAVGRATGRQGAVHEAAEGLHWSGRAGGGRCLRRRYLSRRLHRPLRRCRLRAARLSEKIEARLRDTEGRPRSHRSAAQAGRRGLQTMGKKRETKDIAVTASSGNVFADLGFPEPEEELTKAQLASQLRAILRRRRLTQAAAAELMGLDQPKVSALVNGRLANFSSERLMRLLTALGHDVDITVAAEPRTRAPGRVRVSSATTRPEHAVAGSRGAPSAPGFSEAAPDLGIRAKRRSPRS